jgi:hypothetical protein
MELRELTIHDSAAIVPLAHKLRPEADPGLFDGYLTEMFNLPTFHCFILLQERKLLALSFIRSQRVGQQLFSHIQDWAVRNHRQ